MSHSVSTGERLRRATQLWHAFLAVTGQRFELAQFLKDASLEKQIVAGALASGDTKLAGLAQEWLHGTGQPVPVTSGSRAAAAPRPAPLGPEEPAKPPRYLRGVR